MNKSLGESYEGTAAIVATTRRNMNVTPWVTGSSAEHVNFFFSVHQSLETLVCLEVFAPCHCDFLEER